MDVAVVASVSVSRNVNRIASNKRTDYAMYEATQAHHRHRGECAGRADSPGCSRHELHDLVNLMMIAKFNVLYIVAGRQLEMRSRQIN